MAALTTLSRVSATTIDDAVVDQWRKRLHCCMETSGHHFEHFAATVRLELIHFSPAN